MIYCQNCGAKNEDGSIFCSECGAKLVRNGMNQEQNHAGLKPGSTGYNDNSGDPMNHGNSTPPSGKKNHKKWIVVLMMILLAVLVGEILFFVSGGTDKAKGIISDSVNDSADDQEESQEYVSVAVGDDIDFGSYEQDNNTSNGKEEIEWIVLDKSGDNGLLISKYAIDCQPYNTSYTDVTWGTCSLRTWLNGTFLDKAFSGDEAAKIAATTVTADKNPEYSTDAGSDTQDQVFLLSIPEVEQYFPSDEDRMCVPTAYAIAQGAFTSSKYSVGGADTCWCWLRSPGYISNGGANVQTGGAVDFDGHYVHAADVCVRPAMWIKMDQIEADDVISGDSKSNTGNSGTSKSNTGSSSSKSNTSKSNTGNSSSKSNTSKSDTGNNSSKSNTSQSEANQAYMDKLAEIKAEADGNGSPAYGSNTVLYRFLDVDSDGTEEMLVESQATLDENSSYVTCAIYKYNGSGVDCIFYDPFAWNSWQSSFWGYYKSSGMLVMHFSHNSISCFSSYKWDGSQFEEDSSLNSAETDDQGLDIIAGMNWGQKTDLLTGWKTYAQ